MRELSPEQMARLTQIDYDREMAFIAVREATGETVGVARAGVRGRTRRRVRGDRAGRHEGQGCRPPSHAAADRLGARARAARVVGQVLADNAPMLAFVRQLGFSVKRMPEEPDVVEARLSLE